MKVIESDMAILTYHIVVDSYGEMIPGTNPPTRFSPGPVAKVTAPYGRTMAQAKALAEHIISLLPVEDEHSEEWREFCKTYGIRTLNFDPLYDMDVPSLDELGL